MLFGFEMRMKRIHEDSKQHKKVDCKRILMQFEVRQFVFHSSSFGERVVSLLRIGVGFFDQLKEIRARMVPRIILKFS